MKSYITFDDKHMIQSEYKRIVSLYKLFGHSHNYKTIYDIDYIQLHTYITYLFKDLKLFQSSFYHNRFYLGIDIYDIRFMMVFNASGYWSNGFSICPSLRNGFIKYANFDDNHVLYWIIEEYIKSETGIFFDKVAYNHNMPYSDTNLRLLEYYKSLKDIGIISYSRDTLTENT